MQAIEIELNNLWMKAREIISEFNMYGGGLESDEEDAADCLWNIESQVKKQTVSWDIRVRILDEMLEEFFIGNSGFDDLLIDIASSLCQTKEEKRYLADALAEGNNDYYRGYAANIYKDIGDSEKYIETKLNNMHYGVDYVDVAKFYMKRNDKQKALDYVWQGMEKSSGRLDEIIDYAAPIYIKEENDVELCRMYQFVMETKWNINVVAMAKQLFQYAKKKENYDATKKMLLLILDTCEKSELKKWFGICEKELSEKDWQKEYNIILGKIKKKDEKFYLDICMETGKESVVLESLQNAHHGYDYCDLDYDGYFSRRLLKKYRNEVLALYWRDVNLLLSESKNKNYELAIKLLRKIRSLMKKHGDEEKWRIEFGKLKERNKRKRNFIAMLGNL